MVEFARHFVERLTVYVFDRPTDTIPAETRRQWLEELFPGIRVEEMYLPERKGTGATRGLPRFYLDGLRGKADYLFGNDRRDAHLAHRLDCRWIPVDHLGDVIPSISAEIRADPMRYWEHLSIPARPHYVKKVCLLGAESVGKSWLARELARRLQTVHVPEYARTFVDARNNQVSFVDSAMIARGHIAAEEALARQANRVLICDTGSLSTLIWCEVLYGRCFPWVRQWADRREYDLFLLLKPDVPWEPDPQRSLATGEQRWAFHERCQRELEARGWNYIEIDGGSEERLGRALEAVDALIQSSQA